MKKTIAILMMLVLVFTIFIVPSATADEVTVVGYSSARVEKVNLNNVPNILTYDDFTTNPPAFKITTPEGLQEFQILVSFSEGFKDTVIYLANDINMAEVTNFKPIGSAFKGTFDGQGKMIENLKMKNSETQSGPVKFGLFGYLLEAQVINLIIGPGCDILYDGTVSDSRIGGIVGSITTGSNVDNCWNMGTVTGGKYTGGIVGFIEGSTENNITNCTNSGNITTNFPDKNSQAGGVLGCAANPNTNVINCRNTGYIKGIGGGGTNNSTATGGVVGRTWTSGLVIDGCINNGKVDGGKSPSAAGGVLGGLQGADAVIKNSINYGEIIADATGNGVVGPVWNDGTNFKAIEDNNFNKVGETDPTLATDIETITPDFTPNEGGEDPGDEETTAAITTTPTTAVTTANNTEATTKGNQTTTENGAETTTAEPAKTKGCSSVASGALIVVMGTGALLAVYKKKKKD